MYSCFIFLEAKLNFLLKKKPEKGGMKGYLVNDPRAFFSRRSWMKLFIHKFNY